MRKFLFYSLITVLFPLFFISCSKEDGIRYHDARLVVTGDTEIPFSSRGETREFTAAFEKQRYRYGEPLGEWISVSPDEVGIWWEEYPGQFTLSNIRVVGDALAFEVTAQANGFGTSLSIQLEAWSKEDDLASGIYLTQAPVEIDRQFRITSEQNPFTVPVEGGIFTVNITVESREIINGVPYDWELSSLDTPDYYSYTWLRSTYHCSYAASHHNMELRPGLRRGEYYFEVTARPYYLEADQLSWAYVISDNLARPTVHLLNQYFIHEQDRSLVDNPEALASGSVFAENMFR